jgi:S-adenosylmethionine hydrolase
LVSPASARPIVFLSDYGLEDEFVGICHAVMAGISPTSPIIDLSHAIPPHDVLRGALVLWRAIRFLPGDAIVLAVVDPGVGTGRRPVALVTADGRCFVGPDNGLLSLAWAHEGGAVQAGLIESAEVILEPVSATFHGRDVFAPAAAHLASGLSLERLGRSIDPASLVHLSLTEPEVELGRVHCEVLGVDRFGNVQLSATAEHLRAAGLGASDRIEVVVAGRPTAIRRAATFGDVAEGELAVIVDSTGWLAVVLNRGNGAETLGVAPGDPLTLRAPG